MNYIEAAKSQSIVLPSPTKAQKYMKHLTTIQNENIP